MKNKNKPLKYNIFPFLRKFYKKKNKKKLFSFLSMTNFIFLLFLSKMISYERNKK